MTATLTGDQSSGSTVFVTVGFAPTPASAPFPKGHTATKRRSDAMAARPGATA